MKKNYETTEIIKTARAKYKLFIEYDKYNNRYIFNAINLISGLRITSADFERFAYPKQLLEYTEFE